MMYSILVFVHAVSSLFIGIYLLFPVVINGISSRSKNELIPVLQLILYITRTSHYALIVLVVSGGWMIIAYASYPSILWVIISILLLVTIGGFMGLITSKLKQVLHSEDPGKTLLGNKLTLKWYSWLNSLFVIIVLLIMTNRGLFS